MLWFYFRWTCKVFYRRWLSLWICELPCFPLDRRGRSSLLVCRFAKTGGSYGVNEVLLASVMGSVVFSLLAAQPLCIVGVTGPITVFNYTVYDIMVPRYHHLINRLQGKL